VCGRARQGVRRPSSLAQGFSAVLIALLIYDATQHAVEHQEADPRDASLS
jgi:hypothetical protein